MPVQKGKRRKRPRTKRSADEYLPDESSSPLVEAPSSPRRTGGMRQRFPPWLNLTIGLVLLVLGAAFLISPGKGMPPAVHAIILIGYLVIAGLYLSTALRQYRGS